MKKTQKVLALLLVAVMLLAPAIVVSAEGEILSQWHSFRGNENNMAVVPYETPVSGENTSIKWAYKLKESDDWGTNLSDPIIVDDNLYVVVGDMLQQITKNGEAVAAVKLDAQIDYTCRPVYAQGKIIVPLERGALQAIELKTMKSAWTIGDVTINENEDQQSNNTLYYSDGYVYYGTAYADWTRSYNGAFLCVNAQDGKISWTRLLDDSGYYWSGAVAHGGNLFVGDDSGSFCMINKLDGTVVDEIDLEAPVRSTAVVADDKLYVVTTDGTLHQITADDEKFLTHESVSFADSSTCSPAVSGGKIYVGGGVVEGESYLGAICVISTEDLSVLHKIETAADVKSAPLVSTQDDSTQYVYYTCNTTPGGIEMLTVTSTQAKSENLFTPAESQQNYCMTSVIADNEGTLYYINDSGVVFAVAQKKEDNAILLGDADLNGKTEIEDVLLMQKKVAKLVDFTDDQIAAADVDQNGEIELEDVLLVQKHVAQLIDLNVA